MWDAGSLGVRMARLAARIRNRFDHGQQSFHVPAVYSMLTDLIGRLNIIRHNPTLPTELKRYKQLDLRALSNSSGMQQARIRDLVALSLANHLSALCQSSKP